MMKASQTIASAVDLSRSIYQALPEFVDEQSEFRQLDKSLGLLEESSRSIASTMWSHERSGLISLDLEKTIQKEVARFERLVDEIIASLNSSGVGGHHRKAQGQLPWPLRGCRSVVLKVDRLESKLSLALAILELAKIHNR